MKQQLSNLSTPCLLLERATMLHNIKRLKEHLHGLGVTLRPHLKTCKCIEVAQLMVEPTHAAATVSTLKEAEIFANAGIKDIIYAVGISPDKLPRVMAIRQTGCDLSIVLESEAQATAVINFSKQYQHPIPVLIEINCDGHRSGVLPDDSAKLIAIAKIITESGGILKGLLTHAGESYQAKNNTELHAAAENERLAVVKAAEILRTNGIACPVMSVGSTPTAHFAQNLNGVTEVRAGVFVFFDLVMAGIGVCKTNDIALSVLTTVIGHQPEKGWILVDAGWMAMSRDRGTASQKTDYGYGLVCTLDGKPIDGLIMIAANQEHGILAYSPLANRQLPHLPLGTKLRILPNHACATAAQFNNYHVVEKGVVTAIWERFRGW